MGLIKHLEEKSSELIGAVGNYLSPGAGDYAEYILNKEIKPKYALTALTALGLVGGLCNPAIAEDYLKSKEENKPKSTFSRFYNNKPIIGLNSGINTEGEVPLGFSADWPVLGNKYRLGPTINLGLIRAEDEESNTIITERDKKLGPGTYKYRTDEITTETKDKYIGDFGIRAINKPLKFLKREIIPSLSFGFEYHNEKKKKTGKSTIKYERNEELLEEPVIISNSTEETKNKWVPYIEVGFESPIFRNRDDLSLNLSGRYSDDNLLGKLGITYYF